MFTFNFATLNSTSENQEEICKKKSQLNWFSAKNIDLAKLFEKNYELISQPISNINFPNFPLKLIDSNKVVINLVEKNCRNIIEAESQHSDLLPAKYEGGLKIWECTYDLGKYLLSEKIAFNNKTILDLGCGAGIIGLLALLQGSLVDFQDYNNEVIEFVTIPNVILNCNNYKLVEETCKFYTGDWESFSNLLASNSAKSLYDFIFTSETIYNPDNHQKLYQIFKQHLKKNGIGYVAGKTYYFGVGGGMRQFEKLVLRDNIFDVQVVWKSNEGLQREILKLKRGMSLHILGMYQSSINECFTSIAKTRKKYAMSNRCSASP